MSERISRTTPETNTTSNHSPEQPIEVASLSFDEIDQLRQEAAERNAAIEHDRAAAAQEAAQDVYALFPEVVEKEGTIESTSPETVTVDGVAVTVLESYHDKSRNQNRWIVYRDQDGYEHHTMSFEGGNKETPAEATIDVAEQSTSTTPDIPAADTSPTQTETEPSSEHQEALAAIEASIQRHVQQAAESAPGQPPTLQEREISHPEAAAAIEAAEQERSADDKALAELAKLGLQDNAANLVLEVHSNLTRPGATLTFLEEKTINSLFRRSGLEATDENKARFTDALHTVDTLLAPPILPETQTKPEDTAPAPIQPEQQTSMVEQAKESLDKHIEKTFEDLLDAQPHLQATLQNARNELIRQTTKLRSFSRPDQDYGMVQQHIDQSIEAINREITDALTLEAAGRKALQRTGSQTRLALERGIVDNADAMAHFNKLTALGPLTKDDFSRHLQGIRSSLTLVQNTKQPPFDVMQRAIAGIDALQKQAQHNESRLRGVMNGGR